MSHYRIPKCPGSQCVTDPDQEHSEQRNANPQWHRTGGPEHIIPITWLLDANHNPVRCSEKQRNYLLASPPYNRIPC